MKDYIKFTIYNPTCFPAAVEGYQPRVRALGFRFTNKTVFYFHGSTLNKFCNHLKKNPETEACFYSQKSMKMTRVSGEMKNNLKLKKIIKF